jgi:hypothetical protein
MNWKQRTSDEEALLIAVCLNRNRCKDTNAMVTYIDQ